MNKKFILTLIIFPFIIFCPGCSFQKNEKLNTNITSDIKKEPVNKNTEKNSEAKDSIYEHPLDI